jgi:acyl-CoA synthetase (AMP-forming)/AMP-acid ligase II/3-hydroxymyristoyl/3-hydroxydecanoyl-(acyl carrier protein) dehydratase
MIEPAGLDPLLQGFAPGAPMGWRDGQSVPIERFLGVAAALARRLPQGGHCINACEDRLNFLAGFAAALMTRSVTLLPPSRAPKVLRELGAGYAGAYTLTDVEVGVWNKRYEPMDKPSFPRDQIAVILFTSGTTGTPRPHAKTWGSLVAGARALQARVPNVVGASIIGAVPAQHMWGLETTVMLPLQSGCGVDSACPLLPAEIASALAGISGPRWLVATPAHLRACALSGQPLPALAGVLCSTAPLPEETAQRVEELGGAPVFEIYGSTETGAIATRRTAQTQVFEALAGIDIAIAGDLAVAQGGHLQSPVDLNDVLLARGGAQFVVQGRAADLVKIGGKRSSLGALTAELNRVPGVLDGVFWLPDTAAGESAESGQSRLSAFAVAPGIDKAAIVAHLRDRIDPVFLPRPLMLVASLPRNAAGKLSRDDLKALAASAQDRDAAIRSTLRAQQWQSVPASHPALAGHFPGNPVVPGAWLLALVERAVRQQFGDDLHLLGMPEASFRSPLRPEDRFRIVLDRIAPDRVAFRIEGEAALVADGTLVTRGSP